jgi:S-ribosylhomocysteine lyase
MGCQTGFYFLFDSAQLSCAAAIELLKQVFRAGAAFDGPMPGQSAVECGNYANLDVNAGKAVCAYYADIIANWTEAQLSYN